MNARWSLYIICLLLLSAVGNELDAQTVVKHLKYAFQFSKDSYLGRLYPHAYQGIGVSHNTFYNSAELGNPVAVYAFQGAPIVRLSSRLSLDYEWNFGASVGNNMTNTAIGTMMPSVLKSMHISIWVLC